jgi:hypothetical protein
LPCSSTFTGCNTAWKPLFERLTKILLKISVSLTSSPPSAFSNIVRTNKYKINYGHDIVVVVSIAMVFVTTNTYFLQIFTYLLTLNIMFLSIKPTLHRCKTSAICLVIINWTELACDSNLSYPCTPLKYNLVC